MFEIFVELDGEGVYWVQLFSLANFDTLSFNYIHHPINYLRDDVKYFDQLCSLKYSFESAKIDEHFKNATVSAKWVKQFPKCCNTHYHSKHLKIAQFFFSIPGHKANFERICSLMITHWKDERNGFPTEAIKGVLLLQYNLCDYSCFQFYKFVLEKSTLLREEKNLPTGNSAASSSWGYRYWYCKHFI